MVFQNSKDLESTIEQWKKVSPRSAVVDPALVSENLTAIKQELDKKLVEMLAIVAGSPAGK